MINAQQLAKRGLTLLRSHLLRPLSQSLSSQNPSIKTHFSLISTTPHLLKNSNELGSNDNGDGSSPKLMVIQPRIKPNTLLQAKLNEALNLANSLEEQRDGVFSTDLSSKDLPPHVVVQNPLSGSSKGRSDTYFGPGTVENVKIHINAIESQHDELDGVFVNAILSAVQQRNLERVWDKPVLDRVGLIIEIFHAHAYTKEARLQAELAALMYKKSRLVRVRGMDGRQTFGTRGEAEVVSARGRGSGGRGFISGAGETELELQRRRISDRRKQLVAEIADVRRTRAVQRAGRRKQGILDDRGLATVAVVGYTNAGKSTLVSSLSQSDLYSDDRLFATVDPRVRGVTLPSGRKVLLSDTVGFISDLPVQLVEAFHATLEEVAEADLLVHVLDSSAIDLEEQRKAVLDVLRQIGVSEKKIREMIEVWNKIDLQQETIVQNFEDEYAEDFDDDKVETADEQQMQEEDMEDHQSDNSDGWIGPEVGQEKDEIQINASMCRTQSDIQTKEHRDEPIIDKHPDSQSESEHSPLVKTSAVTGAGLKELLRLIDEKLVQIEEPQHSGAVVERTVFDRKWRPKAEDSNIAAEQ